MAIPKKQRERARKFLGVIDPGNIDYSEFDAQLQDGKPLTNVDLVKQGKQDNVSGGESGKIDKRPDSTDLARTSPTQTVAGSTGVTNIAPPSNLNPFSNMTPRVASNNAMLLGGNVNMQNLSRSLLTNPMDTEVPASNVTTKKQTAGSKLLDAIANTNPSPQSFWKRMKSGLGRGLAQAAPSFAEGDIGGGIGQLFSNTVLNTIPAVDTATQYERNVSQAKERYKIDKTVEDAELQRRKTEADIAETNERLRLSREQRAAQANRDATLDAARLRDDERADADQQLRILEKLPADDPQRVLISRDLATKYKVRVSPRYGIDNEFITIYDEQSGNYIRATKDGTPQLDAQGNTIVVRPGREKTLKNRKDEAMQSVIAKYGGDAKSVARLSVENRREQIIDSLHKDHQEALRNPGKVSTMQRDDADKAYKQAFETMLARDEAFTTALYEREAEELMKTTPKQTRQQSPPSSGQSKGKVKSTVPQGTFIKWKK